MQTGEDSLRYYLDELSYLREQGREFARRYPAVGARLELAAGRPADPHVERLIESFAFLTARLQRRIDADFPEISSAMLSLLYPQLATIVPPMAIACFEPDRARVKWSGGYRIEAHTPLFARNREAIPCRFETCYPVTLWPVSVTEVSVDPPARYGWLSHSPRVASVIRISLECLDPGFDALALDRLRFHLDGEAEQMAVLYDLLAGSTAGLALSGGARLPSTRLQPVGFGPDEEVLPYPPPAHAGYRLLQEYFHFPQKFLFFDTDLGGACLSGKAIELLILLERPVPSSLRLTRTTFRLGATPVINLFCQTSEPLRIDHRRFEYRLVADHRRETTTEIHSVLSVSSNSNSLDEGRRIEPFYSLRQPAGEPKAFWHARRALRDQDGVPGTELYLSFLDHDFSPALPPSETVFAHLLCTNRGLATQIPAGATLEMDQSAPAGRIFCLDKPTASGYPALGGATLWRLVSSLSLGHLSLGGAQGLQALKQILRLHCPDDRPALRRQIEGIAAMECRPIVRRCGSDAWRGFRHGTGITLVLDGDDRLFAGGSRAILAGVLRHFLALHASVNSFSEVAVRVEPDPAGNLTMKQLGWNGSASVTDWLTAEPYRFEFMQAVRLLDGAVRLSARGDFTFPPSEVRHLRPGSDGSSAELTVSFLALDGAFGPLPTAYAEDRLRSEGTRESAFGAFLDIFHHRLLQLLYRIFQIHRPALGGGGEDNPLDEILMAIAGLGEPSLRHRLSVTDSAIPRYASLFGREARSTHGLERMLADFTGQVVTIRQFLGGWAELDPDGRTRLGRHGTLGRDAALGSRCWLDCSAVEIAVGSKKKPLARSTWLGFLPGGWRQSPVADLARLYVRAEVSFRFRLTVAAEAVTPSWLGSARLGHTSFLVTRPVFAPAEISCGCEGRDA
jgi:type VI secretion system protein ImpG